MFDDGHHTVRFVFAARKRKHVVCEVTIVSGITQSVYACTYTHIFFHGGGG